MILEDARDGGRIQREDTMLRTSFLARLACAALGLAAVLAAPDATADATADVRDLRAGKLPLRHEWLGWDGDGHAHLRTLACSSGGTVSCRAATVEILADAPPRKTTLLDVVELYCENRQPCTALDKKTVLAFEAAEKKAIAALPNRVVTPAAPDAKGALGTVAGELTRLEVTAFETANDPTVVSVQLVLRGKGGATETLAVLDPQARTLEGGRIADTFLSADGARAVVVATISTTMMCWDFQSLHTIGVNVPRRRASLANTIGFRAWKAGDMPAALAAFAEATREDATFPLGWYNHAAVASRTGTVAEAAASFTKATALDVRAASRACRDPDFRALRAAEPALFRCTGK